MVPTYSCAGIKAYWNGLELTDGKSSDTFISIAPLVDEDPTSFSNDSQLALSLSANKGCRITLTFKQTSDTNKDLARIKAAQDIVGGTFPVSLFEVKDEVSDHVFFLANNAVLVGRPSIDFAAEMGDVSWVWIAETYIMHDDPVEALARIKDYLGY